VLLWSLAGWAAPLPTHGVVISLDAYGKLLVGYVLVDTTVLEAQGISLWTEQEKHQGKQVPLAHGMRVVGLPAGERLVQEAIDSLLYFDSNGDRYLDPLDPAFASLSLFVDRNQDQKIGEGEVRSLISLGVASISRYGEILMKER
jgi:hypothetical protein